MVRPRCKQLDVELHILDFVFFFLLVWGVAVRKEDYSGAKMVECFRVKREI